MLPADGKRVEAGDWVVVHMGFAMDAIGADEAMDIFQSMAELGMADGVEIPVPAAE
jgi:hydrogenase maturation factor